MVSPMGKTYTSTNHRESCPSSSRRPLITARRRQAEDVVGMVRYAYRDAMSLMP